MVIGILIVGLAIHFGGSVVFSSLSLTSFYQRSIWLLLELGLLGMMSIWPSIHVDLHGLVLVDYHHTLGMNLNLPSLIGIWAVYHVLSFGCKFFW